MSTLPSQINGDISNDAGVTLTTSTGGTSFGEPSYTLTNQGTLIDNTSLTGGIGTIDNTAGATFIVEGPLAVGTIENEVGGTITLSNSLGDVTVPANVPFLGQITNDGLLLASFINSAQNVKESIDATLANTGTLKTTLQTTAGATTGTLELQGGGSSSGNIIVGTGTTLDFSGGSYAISGTVDVDAGAILNLAPSTITGPIGSLTLNGTLILGSNAVAIGAFSLGGTAILSDSATVALDGSGGTLGGVLTDGGTVVLSSGQSTTVTTTLNLSGGETLENDGSLIVGATITSDGNSHDTLKNAAGAILAFTSGTVSIAVANIVNDGVIDVDGASVAVVPPTLDGHVLTSTSLSGSGTIDVMAGTLDLSQASLPSTLSSITDDGTLLLGGNSVAFNGFSIAGTVNDSATLTLGGSGTLSGALTGGTVDNSSGNTLTLTNYGSQPKTITANAFINDGVVSATFPASGLSGTGTELIDAVLTNAGTIATTTTTGTGTLELQGGGASSGSITVAAGTTLDVNSGTYSISGTYGSSATTEIDAGATVTFAAGTTVNVSTGTWRLGTQGGLGGTPNPGGTLDLSQATVTGPFNQLAMNGTLILGSNPVTVSGFAIAGEISDPGTLTLTSTGSESHILNGILTGGGTVVLASGQSATVTSTLSLSGGETLENEGLLTVSTGGIGSDGNPPDTLDNASGGTLAFTGGTVAVNVATVENDGLIKVSGGSAFFMGALNGAGAIDVAAGTLDLSPATLAATLGSITDDGTLDLGNNAVSVSSLSLAGTLFDSATVTMYGGTGAVLGGTLTGGHGTLILEPGPSDSISGALVLDDGETLKNAGTLLISGTGITDDASGDAIDNLSLGTLELSGSNVAIGVATLTLTNAGTIDVTGGTTTITGTVSSSGAIEVAATGTLDLSHATITGTLGSITDAGTLILGDNSVTISDFSLAATATLSVTGGVSGGATVTLIGGTDDGSLPYSTKAELGRALSGGGTVILSSFAQSYGIATNLPFAIDVTLENEGSLVVAALAVVGSGTLDNTSVGTLTLTGDNSGSVNINGLGEVDNAGLMVVSAGSDAAIRGAFTDTGTITVSSGATLDLTSATITGPLGSISDAGTLLLGDSAVTIDGLSLSGGNVDVTSGGNLSLQQAVTGTGTLTIDSGSTLSVSTAISAGEVVQFNGAGGLLALAPGASFGGSISGFAAGDTIDLEGTAATAVSYADGNLVVSDNGETVATLALAGTYSASQFAVEPDGAGGSDIVFNSNTYSGQIRFEGNGLSFDGLAFNTQFTANVTVTYLTSITSSSADGTISYSASSYALNPDGSGAASSGFTSGGSTAEALPPNSFTNPVLTVTASSSPISGGDDWIARNVLTLDISSGTSTTITGTAFDTIYDEFGNSTTLSTPFTLTRPIAAASSDFNGDGTSDILFMSGATGALGIDLMNNGAVSSFADAGTPSAGWTLVGVGDFNGTGADDILWRNASTGAIGADVVSNGQVTGWDDLGTPSAGWTLMGLGDFNGTDTDDILWQNTSTGAIGADVVSNGQVTGWDDLGTPSAGWTLVGLGDFNGTGTDILFTNASTGAVGAEVVSNGQVTGWDDLGTPSAGWTLVGIGDFNGTGTDDILWQNASTGAVGAEVVSNGQVTGWDDFGSPGPGWSVIGTGDFNGDGTSDILFQNTGTTALGVDIISNGQVSAWDNLGTPGAGWNVVGDNALGLATQVTSVPAPLGDLNGDGTTDIVWRNPGTGGLGAFLMSNGAVGATADLGTPSAGWTLVGLGDFNGTGTSDILWQNAGTGAIGADVVSDGQVTGWDDLGTPSAGWTLVGIGDFNGTGTDDILFTNAGTGALGAEVVSNGQVTGWDDLGTPSAGWTLVGTGDFNGTGTDDILWRNTSTGALGADVVSNGQVTGWDDLGTPSAGWTLVGIGDFNGTGTDDILWQNASTGAVGAEVVSNGQVTGWDDLGTVPTGSSVAGIGDYNGDGTSDILWQNSTTGALAVTIVSNGTVSVTSSLTVSATGLTLLSQTLAPSHT